ncbi:MAG: Cgl0159 family (beta/alpha)8-fold protein, partial [Terriglobia bacterium]
MATAAHHHGEYCFQPGEFFPMRLFEAITDVRVDRPEVILEEARSRRKRPRLTLDGRLAILATDHPGRRVTGWAGDLLGMGDRHAYLARALRVLTAPGCDGIM